MIGNINRETPSFRGVSGYNAVILKKRFAALIGIGMSQPNVSAPSEAMEYRTFAFPY